MNKKILDKDNNKESEYGPIHSNRFNVNPKANKRIWVVDDFYEDPLAVRKHALSQTYYDDPGSKTDATLDNGLLEIFIPLAEEAKPKSIKIK